jgi:hypothetical protein
MLRLPVPVSLEGPSRSAAARVIASRVLVVDEEPQIACGLAIMLRSAGYDVGAVGTWFEARYDARLGDASEVAQPDPGVRREALQ